MGMYVNFNTNFIIGGAVMEEGIALIVQGGLTIYRYKLRLVQVHT